MNATPIQPDPAPHLAPTPPRGRRFASMMYEGVLLFGVVFLAGYLFDTLTQSRHALAFRHARQVWLFLAIGVYFVLCWRRSGQTLPMKAWNIRLVSANGNALLLRQMAVRYACMWILPVLGALVVWLLSIAIGWPSVLMLIVAAPFLVFVPTWFTADQQFLHDQIAGTRLVTAPPRKK